MRIVGTGRTQAQIDASRTKQNAEDRTGELQAYLDETDRFVARSVETGEPIRQEILDNRARARVGLSALRAEYSLDYAEPTFPADAVSGEAETR